MGKQEDPTRSSSANNSKTKPEMSPDPSADTTVSLSGAPTLDGGLGSVSTRTNKAKDPGAIGAYQLVRKLGEGGMGQVWLPEQTMPVKRQVALKLIKGGLYDSAMI